MSPKGVEHGPLLLLAFQPHLVCIHQCRRKALSTRAVAVSPDRETDVMSPKGVGSEGRRDHDCYVHPSMSPKGVEHLLRDQMEPLARRASINVAERR